MSLKNLVFLCVFYVCAAAASIAFIHFFFASQFNSLFFFIPFSLGILFFFNLFLKDAQKTKFSLPSLQALLSSCALAAILIITAFISTLLVEIHGLLLLPLLFLFMSLAIFSSFAIFAFYDGENFSGGLKKSATYISLDYLGAYAFAILFCAFFLINYYGINFADDLFYSVLNYRLNPYLFFALWAIFFIIVWSAAAFFALPKFYERLKLKHSQTLGKNK